MAKAKFNINDLLNNQSKDSKAAEAKQEAFRIVNIPLDKLVPSSANIYGIREVEELAASIESMGLLHNLVVRELDGGRYEIISGERRYHACKLLHEGGNADYAVLPCKVEGESSDAIAELKLIFANATARELTDFEKVEQAARMKELFKQLKAEGYEVKGRLREIVAGVLDVSPAQVGRLESVSEKLIPEYKEELKAGNIGISAAYDASTLPEDKQRETLDTYKAEGAKAVKKAKTRRTHEEVIAAEAAKQAKKRRCYYGDGKCLYADSAESHIDHHDGFPCYSCCDYCNQAPICGNRCERVVGRLAEEVNQTPVAADQPVEIQETPGMDWDAMAAEGFKSAGRDQKPSVPDIGRAIAQQRTEDAQKAARQLRAVADNVPFDATCEADGEEINIKAACLRAAKLLEVI